MNLVRRRQETATASIAWKVSQKHRNIPEQLWQVKADLKTKVKSHKLPTIARALLKLHCKLKSCPNADQLNWD